MKRVRVAVLLVAAVALLGTGCMSGGADDKPESKQDPLAGLQWGLTMLDPRDHAWEITQGEGVTVAVVDSGVMRDHPDLEGRVDAGVDLVDGELPADDEYGHGTHVAGLIAAAPDNGIGIAGLAPQARILPVRVLDADGNGVSERTAEGIRFAVDEGAQVINLSIELDQDTEPVREAIEYAAAGNVVVVAAGGNIPCPDEGLNGPVYPAAYPGVIGVGGIDETKQVSSFSSCGDWVDVLAPATGIVSITASEPNQPECRAEEGPGDDSWCILSGTSEAAPFVSAAAALRIAQLGPESYDASAVADDVVAAVDDRTDRGILSLATLLNQKL